ncbi:uncharacterized protein IUM83_15786 [Phytophthora cinnamomi]|uniref:uncharacterized protein n=1 Tax=Phytophthora cinnamomi TaxID=4785 RepID=UPI003559D8A5|nr:hypothetical protein IUM83_15786 [Phytophthora cinnamomi]
MDIEVLEAPLHAVPPWTEDEVAFVSALLSDAPDVLSDEQSSPSPPASVDGENDVPKANANRSASQPRKSVKQQKKSLSPEERAAARRASHRETMRRSRQRFRDQIAAMMRTVQELEGVRAQALEQQQQQQRSDDGLQGQVAHLERQRQQLLDENDALHAQLVDSLLAITRAHPDNFEHDQVQRRVAGKLGEKQADDGADFYVMSTGNGAIVKRDPVTLCDFVTWDVGTVGHCLQLVRDATSEIARFYTAVAGAKPQQQMAVDMMGWRQLRRALVKQDTCVEFAFDKVFAGYSPGQLFHKTWAFCRDQRQFAAMLEPVLHALQLEVLHQINDDIVVVRRMQQELSPEGEKQTPTKYRSIYLLYRMTSPAGLFVVLQSVNPSFTRRCGCANNLWFESFLWFGFSSAEASDSGKAGCRVRFGGSLDGHSEEFARRWQREIFFMLLSWETHNVAPVVLLPQSDSA